MSDDTANDAKRLLAMAISEDQMCGYCTGDCEACQGDAEEIIAKVSGELREWKHRHPIANLFPFKGGPE